MVNRSDGEPVKDWSRLVGHRCIVIEDEYMCSALEVKIVEVSPKGRVKMRFPSQIESWKDKADYLLIEDLGLGKEDGKKK